jgi:hypothetical protein
MHRSVRVGERPGKVAVSRIYPAHDGLGDFGYAGGGSEGLACVKAITSKLGKVVSSLKKGSLSALYSRKTRSQGIFAQTTAF